MRLSHLKDIVVGLFLLAGVAFAGASVARDLSAGLGALAPCQTGYRGPTLATCSRPLPRRGTPAPL